MFFYLPKLNVFFATIQYARWAEIKHMCFFVDAQPYSNARAHLKQRKNITDGLVSLKTFGNCSLKVYLHWKFVKSFFFKFWEHIPPWSITLKLPYCYYYIASMVGIKETKDWNTPFNGMVCFRVSNMSIRPRECKTHQKWMLKITRKDLHKM